MNLRKELRRGGHVRFTNNQVRGIWQRLRKVHPKKRQAEIADILKGCYRDAIARVRRGSHQARAADMEAA